MALHKKLSLALATITAAAVLGASPAQADPGPPSGGNWHRCSGTAIFGGSSWRTVSGVIYAPRNTAMYYLVRITPAYPFGWSGTAVLNGGAAHPTVWIPVGTSHWFTSPAIFTSPSNGTVGVSVSVRPNPGVINNYGVEVWSPYSCSYWA